MSIRVKAEEKATSEAYRRTYEEFVNMPYNVAFNLLRDAKGVLDTKCILGKDNAQLEGSQIDALISLAEEIADNIQAYKTGIRVWQSYRSSTE